MIIKILLLSLFLAYGGVAVYNFVMTYNAYKFSIEDNKCNAIFYGNYANCILGSLLSLFIVTFLTIKYLCEDIMDCNVSFGIFKLLILLGFIAVNIWNSVNLSKDDTCYKKYNIYDYSIAFISLIGSIILILFINCLKNQKKNKVQNY